VFLLYVLGVFFLIILFLFFIYRPCFVKARALVVVSGFGARAALSPFLAWSPRQVARQCAAPEGCQVHLFVPSYLGTAAGAADSDIAAKGAADGAESTNHRQISVHRV